MDSTANSYIIDWFYHDYVFQTNNELLKRISSIAKDVTVRIKTDELGAFKEIVNWKDIKDFISKGIETIKKETMEIPNIDKVIALMESLYVSKESIEAAAIKDIQQFYTYHGGKYKLGEELNGSMKVPNLLGGEPFDADMTIWLEEINPDDNNSLIRAQQTVNSEQLTKATFDYLTKMSKTMGVALPKWEEAIKLKNVTWVASSIHDSGWITYSIETKEVSAENVLNVEERIIEIQ